MCKNAAGIMLLERIFVFKNFQMHCKNDDIGFYLVDPSPYAPD